ncbi:hypothetical protein D3C77_650170 [compost metagenome]
MQDEGLAGVVAAHPRARLEGGQRGDVEDLSAAAANHGVAEGVAQPRQSEHVELKQLALALPVLLEKAAGASGAGIVDQQVDLIVALL